MKKILRIIYLVFSLTIVNQVTYAQSGNSEENFFGLNISPLLLSKTSISETIKTDIISNNPKYSFSLGVNYYIHLAREKYFFSVGFGFDTKTIELSGSFKNQIVSETYNMKYLALSPLGFFLKTDDVGILDLYIIAMTNIDLKILIDSGGKLNSGDKFFISEMKRFGLEGKISLGIEYVVGDTTSILAGITCVLDILNCVDKISNNDLGISIRTYRFGVFLGINF